MTEKELLDLLTDVRPDYIAQTEAFRRGSAHPKERHTAKRILSWAAMFAVILAIGAITVYYLAPNWKAAPAQEAENAPAQYAAPTEAKVGSLDTAGSWQTEILTDNTMFYSQEYETEMVFSAYTGTYQGQMDAENVTPWRYAMIDMDGNGTEELVIQYKIEHTISYPDSSGETVYVSSNGLFGEYFTLLFWEAQGEIQERMYNVRQMNNLRANGTFYRFDVDIQEGWARLTGLDGNNPSVIDIPEDQSDQPEPEWHSFDGGDEHSQYGPSADDLLRLKQWQIHYVDAEGNETALWADLFIGDGYSIYIPQTDWAYRQTNYNGIAADEWDYEKNNDIRMLIFKIGGEVEDAEKLVRETEGDWSFFPDKQGNLYAERDGRVMNVCFVKAEVETFVIMQVYPEEAYEGAGRMLSVLYDTFCAWPSEVNTWHPKEE